MNDDKKFDAKKFGEDLRDQIHRDIHVRIERGRRPIVVGIHLGKRSYGLGIFWGVLLTLVGTIFLLDNLGIINGAQLFRFWPMLLIIAGAFNIVDRERRSWGFVLLVVGAFLQLNQLGIAHFSWAAFWPIILIAVGLLVMWNSLTSRKSPPASSGAGGDPRTTVNGAAIFSGLERRVTSQDFKGGHVTAIFGGIELDLSEANIQGDEATLEVNAVFGGAEIRIPYSWQVSYCGSPVFGGVEDKTRVRSSDETSGAKTKVLNITGTVMFGGLEIKN